ncbi:MAG: hypothetical protein KY467_17230 [Gemmatimonadetes bacterium]|nr:hypothetical protein [Gemmatimonadota bacterium]
MSPPRAPAEARLLDAWERGAAASAARRALLLLSLALPGAGAAALAAQPVGRRDRHLFRLRRALFGDALACIAGCPACGERLEFALSAGEVLEGSPPPADEPLRVARGGWEVEVRLPTTQDLLRVTEGGPAADRAGALLRRCVVSATRRGRPADPGALPAAVLEAVDEEMARADLGSQVRLSLACPACAHGWEAPFDIVAFLWRELDAWARRVTAEVHVLASRYGWSERQILSLGPRRRGRYLELVGA